MSERSVQDGRRKVEGLTTENIELQKKLTAMNADKKDLEVQLEEWEKVFFSVLFLRLSFRLLIVCVVV